MKTVAALLLVPVLAAAGFFIFIYSGSYNIAASDAQLWPSRWLLQTTLDNSVRAHASHIKVPPLDRKNKEEGFRHFDRICVTCHGAPGIHASEIGIGLRPAPPDLSKHVNDWAAGELFWIVNHGFKITGMPAFGRSHLAGKIWDIVAFLKDLPNMPASEYQRLRRELRPESPGHPQTQPEPLPEEMPDQPFPDRQRETIHRQAV